METEVSTQEMRKQKSQNDCLKPRDNPVQGQFHEFLQKEGRCSLREYPTDDVRKKREK